MTRPPFTLDRNAGLVVDRHALVASGVMDRQLRAAEALYKRNQEREMSELPPLPGTDVSWVDGKDEYGYDTYDHAFSADQMREYGRACVKYAVLHTISDVPERERLLAEIAALAADARRYRWLRKWQRGRFEVAGDEFFCQFDYQGDSGFLDDHIDNATK